MSLLLSRRSELCFIQAKLDEFAFEADKAEAYTGFDGAEGNLRTLGNFCMGPTLKVGEFDDEALSCWNLHEGCADLGAFYVAPCFVPGVGEGGCFIKICFLERSLLYDRAAAGSAQVVDGAVMQDGDEPVASCTRCGSEGGGASPDRKEGILDEVFGSLGVGYHTIGEGIEHATVAVIERLQCPYCATGYGIQ